MSLINSQLLLAIAIPVIGGISSGLITKSNLSWYKRLNKPPTTPPNVAFPIVWTTLYATMGISSYLIYNTGLLNSIDVTYPLSLYAIQLAFNFAWTPLFFGLNNLPLASIDALCLLASVSLTSWEFYKILPLSGLLMIPYIAWVSYASYLTIWIWRNNSHKKKSK